MYINSINPTMNFYNAKANSLRQTKINMNTSKNLCYYYNISNYNKINVHFKGKARAMSEIPKFFQDLYQKGEINEITLKACKESIENFKLEEPKEYELIKNVKLDVEKNIHLVKDNTFKSPENDLDEYITQTVNFINDAGDRVGYYTLLYNKQGKPFEDILNIL